MGEGRGRHGDDLLPGSGVPCPERSGSGLCASYCVLGGTESELEGIVLSLSADGEISIFQTTPLENQCS